MGPLHDPVTWYKITHADEQVALWDFQNRGRCRWTGLVPLRNLLTLYHVTGSHKGPIGAQLRYQRQPRDYTPTLTAPLACNLKSKWIFGLLL